MDTKKLLLPLASFGVMVAGGFLHAGVPVLGKVLVFGGLIAFLAAWIYVGLTAGWRCPHCGRRLNTKAVSFHQKNGLRACPYCGAILHADR